MNRYEIGQQIGKGGYATVVAARDNATGQDVAIKILRRQEPVELVRFEREAMLLRSMDHPGIVKVFDSGVAGGKPFIVMELLKGLTVDAVIKRSRLSIKQALGIAIRVAGALDYAHAMGVIHRDVKPTNTFITLDHQIKLMDFGMARFMAAGNSLTAADMFLGTPDFIAPEVVDGRRPGAAADLYSLGAMTYLLLALEAPFTGSDPIRVMLSKLDQDAPPLRQKAPDVPEVIEALVMRCLARDPRARYPSLADFAHEARNALAGVP